MSTDYPTGQLVHTNLTGAPYLVKVTGAKVVGRDQSGDMVLAVGPGNGGVHRITLSRSDRLPVVLGRWVTRLALLALLLQLIGFTAVRVRGLRMRRSVAA